MNVIKWNLYISIILIVSFQVLTAEHVRGHNTAPDNSTMGGHSSIENHQEHPQKMQKYAIFDYRTPDRNYGETSVKRKSSKLRHKVKYDIDDDENNDCTKCGSSMAEKGGRVVNGKVVKPMYRYPWIVPLLIMNQIMCGGAIISKTFILTAAHCIFNQANLMHTRCQKEGAPLECYFQASLFSIKLLGNRELETVLKIKRLVPHPKFDYSKIVNDIALLELEEPLECSGKISPICLPTTEEMYKTGKTLFVAGWGSNEPDKMRGPQLLREGAMKQIDVKYCIRPELPKDTTEQYQCSSGTSQTSCKGDSGTSNFIRYEGKFYALGVTSHGKSEYCNPTWPTTFSKVLYFLKWIKEHVKDLPEP